MSKLVHLNVGGCRFTTSVSTLTREPNSMLARMFSEDWIDKGPANQNTETFIDRDGRHFYYILNYLRDGSSANIPKEKSVREELLYEAEYYQLDGLLAQLNQFESQLKQPEYPYPRSVSSGDILRWRPEAIDGYWRTVHIYANMKRVHGQHILIGIGAVYKDGNAIRYNITCGSCDEMQMGIVLSTDFHYQDTIKSIMKAENLIVEQQLNKTCAIVRSGGGNKIMHMPLSATFVEAE